MRFYYISLFSLILLGLIYVFGTMFLVWLGKKLRKRWSGAWKVMVPLFLLLYIGPIAEELWIAWNFDRLCEKDAGIFIYKTVEVEGFYNGTGATLDLVRPGKYKFIEADDKDGKGVIRVEYGDEQWKGAAIARYQELNPGKLLANQKYFRVDMDEKTQALVYPEQGDSWRIRKLDRPTSQYLYKWAHMNTPIAHSIGKVEKVVEDIQGSDVLGRYVDYGRRAPWFYVGLDKPIVFCKEADDDARKRGNSFGPSMVLTPRH